MERSFPPAWEVRGCLLFFLFFLPFCLFLLEQETCLGTFRGLSHEHCQRLSESPGPLGRAVLAGESHPRQPVPRASLSAAGLECSLYHLLSGALPEPKIAQVGQEFLCGCPLPSLQPWRKIRLTQTRRGWSTWVLSIGKQRGLYLGADSIHNGYPLLCTVY